MPDFPKHSTGHPRRRQHDEEYHESNLRFIRTLLAIFIPLLVAISAAGHMPTDIDTSASGPTSAMTQTVQAGPTRGEEGWATWSETIAPNYVTMTQGADLEDRTRQMAPETFENEVDALGRPSLARACITPQMARKGAERERDRLPNPLGWPRNTEVTIEMCDGTYHGWLFNRSHLLAKSLGGSDERDNLVTGTRCQNVGSNDGTGGMGLPESMTRDWLAQNPDGTVLYEAEPVYVGEELIPRVVVVDVLSSDGAIDADFVTYNAAKGFTIDYATGAWSPAA